MKKVIIIVALMLTGLSSCKKDQVCSCVTLQESGKMSVVKGETVTTWSVTDTLSVGNDCSTDGDTIYLNQVSRTRVQCD